MNTAIALVVIVICIILILISLGLLDEVKSNSWMASMTRKISKRTILLALLAIAIAVLALAVHYLTGF